MASSFVRLRLSGELKGDHESVHGFCVAEQHWETGEVEEKTQNGAFEATMKATTHANTHTRAHSLQTDVGCCTQLPTWMPAQQEDMKRTGVTLYVPEWLSWQCQSLTFGPAQTALQCAAVKCDRTAWQQGVLRVQADWWGGPTAAQTKTVCEKLEWILKQRSSSSKTQMHWNTNTLDPRWL